MRAPPFFSMVSIGLLGMAVCYGVSDTPCSAEIAVLFVLRVVSLVSILLKASRNRLHIPRLPDVTKVLPYPAIPGNAILEVRLLARKSSGN